MSAQRLGVSASAFAGLQGQRAIEDEPYGPFDDLDPLAPDWLLDRSQAALPARREAGSSREMQAALQSETLEVLALSRTRREQRDESLRFWGLEPAVRQRQPLHTGCYWFPPNDGDLAVIAARLPEIETLRLGSLGGNEEISDEGLALLAPLKQLRVLDLTGCSQITDRGLAHLSQLALQTLCLNGTQVSDEGLHALAPGLAALRLGAGAVTLAALTPLVNLHSLELNGCAVTEGLHNLPASLTHLQLNECHELADADLRHLGRLTHLRYLRVNGCPGITSQRLAGLREGLLRGLEIDTGA